jgi:hypothetical protein
MFLAEMNTKILYFERYFCKFIVWGMCFYLKGAATKIALFIQIYVWVVKLKFINVLIA